MTRSPARIGVYAALIALVVCIALTGVVAVFFLPARADPEKFGRSCGHFAGIVAIVVGFVAYGLAKRRRT